MGIVEPEPGDNFGPYVLEKVLGEGATGVVFGAIRRKDRLPVALKILRRELAKDEIFTKRFVHEARAAREVAHPHVVSVLDAGTVDGRHFLAMSYIDGGSLAHRLTASGPLPMRDVIRIAAEVGSALDALHACGLVHRDVKPANVLLDARGSAVLTDFGLAKGRAYTVLTRPGEALGTVDYLAPEVIRGEGATGASDVYSLGCVVFACLAGRPPFAAPSPIQVTVGHLGGEPPDPCAERDDASPSLSTAVLWALEKEPAKRPATAHAYALAILRAAGLPAT